MPSPSFWFPSLFFSSVSLFLQCPPSSFPPFSFFPSFLYSLHLSPTSLSFYYYAMLSSSFYYYDLLILSSSPFSAFSTFVINALLHKVYLYHMIKIIIFHDYSTVKRDTIKTYIILHHMIKLIMLRIDLKHSSNE